MEKPRSIPIPAYVACLLLFLSGPGSAGAAAAPQIISGTLKGRVVDEDVRSPVILATIEVMGAGLKTESDDEGRFVISDVPVGTYVLEVKCRLYRSKLFPDVVIKSSRITFLEIPLKLSPELQEHEEVTVTAGYYSDTRQKSASMTRFSYEEIRRAAGSAGDVSRIVSGLPSIARVNDQVNGLVVRGGNPMENAFYIDNIPIPNINHYPIQGSSGGALALLNVDFIQDVSFYSGGFSSLYGNRLSSVMDINFRDGNRDEIDLQADFSMAGFGLIGEGPLPRSKGSWMVSGRRSYLDLISRYFDVGVSPSWEDIQGKAVLDLSPGSRLTLLGVWGNDKSGWDREESLALGDSSYGFHDARSEALGVNWFKTWGNSGFSNTSLSRSRVKYNIIFSDTATERLLFRNHSREASYSFRNVNTLRVTEPHRISFGVEVLYLDAHSDYALGAGTDVMGNPYPGILIDVRRDSGYYAGFCDTHWRLRPGLDLNLGVRLDHLEYNRNTNLSPRISLSLGLTGRTSLNAAAGIFTQNLPHLLLFQNDVHRALKDPMAAHFVLGLSHLLTENTRLTIEAYAKGYRRMPLDPQQSDLFILDEISYHGFYTSHERLVDTGRARSYGVEVMVQKKLAERLYGLVSASYFRTFYRGLDGEWRPRVYDNRFLFSAEGGYRAGRSWELSCRWHYAGGVPFTPFDLDASRKANTGVFDRSRINRERLKPYHSLNLRADKRFYFARSNLTLYFSVWNLYNRGNLASTFWNTLENRPDFEYQWGFLPILGIEFEF